MGIYYLLIAVILVNGFLFGKKRKWFVFSTFFLLIVVASLRSTNVGIDLAGHYARYYQLIVETDWGRVGELATFTGYDPGYIVFCKLIGLISVDPRCYIITTSIFVYFSVAVYIYRYSSDVVLETFLFFTTCMYFMYMNIIAQAMAIAILMWAVRYMVEKKYLKYCILALVAISIHSSAIIILLFVPLAYLKPKKKYIILYILGMTVMFLGFNSFLTFLVNTIFPQFGHYLAGNVHGEGQKLDIYTFSYLMIYIGSLLLAWLFIIKGNKEEREYLELKRANGVIDLIPQINNNFLIYMTISAIVFRILATQVYVVSRMGYYTYFFGLTLLTRSTNYVQGKNRIFVKLGIYILLLLFFLRFGYSAGKLSYGVVPYEMYK